MARTAEFKDRVQVHSSIEKEELDVLEEIRWRERRDRADIIRDAIVEYLKNHKEGNDTFKLDNWNKDPTFQAVPALFSDKLDWRKHYQNSDPKSRTDIRIKLNEIIQQINNVEVNDNKKYKEMHFT